MAGFDTPSPLACMRPSWHCAPASPCPAAFAEPFDRLSVILQYAIAVPVHDAETVLRPDLTLFGQAAAKGAAPSRSHLASRQPNTRQRWRRSSERPLQTPVQAILGLAIRLAV